MSQFSWGWQWGSLPQDLLCTRRCQQAGKRQGPPVMYSQVYLSSAHGLQATSRKDKAALHPRKNSSTDGCVCKRLPIAHRSCRWSWTSDDACSRTGVTSTHHVTSDHGQASLQVFGQVLPLLHLTGSPAAPLRNLYPLIQNAPSCCRYRVLLWLVSPRVLCAENRD